MMNKEQGFTLVEVMATAIISTLVIMVLFSVIINFEEVLHYAQDNVDMRRDHRIIKERLGRYIRNSQSVKKVAGDLRIDLGNYEGGGSRRGIIFLLSDTDLIYQWCPEDDDTPKWSDPGSEVQVNSDQVNVNQFKPDPDDRWVRIKITLENKGKEYSFTETYYRRNPGEDDS